MGDDVGACALREALRSGYQLRASRVVPSIRPAVIILACYARTFEDTEIVDDYEALIEAAKVNIGGHHVDKFLASSIRILADRMVAPSKAAFDDQNIPAIFRALTTAD